MATKKPAPRKASTRKAIPKPGPIPEVIYAHASPRSLGGVSLFEAQYQVNSATVQNFMAQEGATDAAVARLQMAGFQVLQVTPFTINIAGPREAYESAFQTKIVARELPVIKEEARPDTATFLDSPDTSLLGLIKTEGTAFEDLLEGVALEVPRYFMAGPSAYAPLKSYWHLRLPGDVSLALNADRAHRAGITGKGVKVAMVDTGWFKHPYFVNRGYRVSPVVLGPSAVNPLDDEVGHGSGESANIFAAAPDAQLLPVKMNFVNSIGAFNAAVGLSPDIITCSWGSSIQFGPLSAADQALAAAIAAAVAAGIVVIFSAGNGHYGFPGQMPDVISAGGAFMRQDETLEASNYASSFVSSIYAGRKVPDVCGLVGMLPKAIYLMLPLQPEDEIDQGNAGGTFPNGDETTTSDGWAAFSGTSAAAPQLAGISALIKQACPVLKPADVKDILAKSARSVTLGHGNPSTGGNAPPLAVGAGLADANKAVMLAKLRCLGPIVPGPGPIGGPIAPEPAAAPPFVVEPPPAPADHAGGTVRPLPVPQPIRPVRPEPIKPSGPIVPERPLFDGGPIAPLPVKPPEPGPITPLPIKPGPIKPRPIKPQPPVKPIKPIRPEPPAPIVARHETAVEAPALSEEDAQALEQMIIDSDVDE